MSASFPERAIILAAGLGLRMRPLTDRLPKPLVPVAGRPLVDYSLDFVAAAGIADVVINASYRADQLEAHVRICTHPRVHVSREETPLETGGGIRQALPWLGSMPFVSINSDVICLNTGGHALHRLREAWDDACMDALLLLHPVERALGYDGPGDFFLAPDGALRRRGDRPRAPYVFAGIQLLHPRFFVGCPESGPFSLNLLYNRGVQPDGTLHRVRGLLHTGDWLHVGDLAGLERAEAYFSAARAQALSI